MAKGSGRDCGIVGSVAFPRGALSDMQCLSAPSNQLHLKKYGVPGEGDDITCERLSFRLVVNIRSDCDAVPSGKRVSSPVSRVLVPVL